MTKQTQLWLVNAIFAFSTTVCIGSIEIYSTIAVPKKEAKPVNPIDRIKLIFSFKGGEKKDRPRVSTNGRRTRLAGSRDTCKAEIVALMPNSNLGVSISGNPTFWFYIAPDANKIESLKFRIFDRSQTEIWATQLPKKSAQLGSGLLPVSYQARALTDGIYQWEFSYQETGCDRVFLSGSLHKESHPNLLLDENPQTRLRIYAQHGIWHELLTELIRLRQKYPRDSQLAADFKSLFLESESVKYYSSINPNTENRDLMEKIVKSQPID